MVKRYRNQQDGSYPLLKSCLCILKDGFPKRAKGWREVPHRAFGILIRHAPHLTKDPLQRSGIRIGRARRQRAPLGEPLGATRSGGEERVRRENWRDLPLPTARMSPSHFRQEIGRCHSKTWPVITEHAGQTGVGSVEMGWVGFWLWWVWIG